MCYSNPVKGLFATQGDRAPWVKNCSIQRKVGSHGQTGKGLFKAQRKEDAIQEWSGQHGQIQHRLKTIEPVKGRDWM